MKKFIFKIYGIEGSIYNTSFANEMEVIIHSDKISEATEKIDKYLSDNFLKARDRTLKTIEIIK